MIGVRVGISVGATVGAEIGLSPKSGGTTDSTLFVILGQSNEIGEADYSGTVAGESQSYSQDATESYDTSFSGCTFLQRYSQARTTPVVWTTLAEGDLRPYAGAGALNIGPSQSFGRVLAQYTANPPDLVTCAVFGTFSDDWLPGSALGLLEEAYAQIDARIAATGKTVGGILFGQCEGDASDSTKAANWGTNMTTIAAALRTRYGSTLPIVTKRCNVNCSQPFVTALRTTQATWIAGDSLSAMINTDDFTAPGNLHYNSRDLQTYGERAAAQLLRMKGLL